MTDLLVSTTCAVTLDRAELADACKVLKLAVQRRCYRPVLLGALLEVSGSLVTITTTDEDLSVSVNLSGSGAGNGRGVVPFAALADVCKGRGSDVSVRLEGGAWQLVGPNGAATVPALPVDEWPQKAHTSLAEATTVLGGFPWAAVAGVLPAASSDEARPILTGVLMGGGAVVSTDSYRLHYVDQPGPVGDLGVLVPARALRAVAVALKCKRFNYQDRVMVVTGERDARFSTAGVKVTTRLIEGEFPNWRGLVPSSSVFGFDVADGAQLVPVLKDWARFSKGSAAPVRLERNEDGTVSGRIVVQDVGERSTVLPGVTAWGDWPADRGPAFNPAYLADAVDGFTGRAGCIDNQKPCHLMPADPDGVRRLLMPVRV